jgi:hypothetical protein
MNKAKKLAMHPALATTKCWTRGAFVALLAGIALTGCGGGAETTENPLTQAPPPGNAPYTGPVARDADVLRFQQEFWSNAKTTDRCGSCHNEVVGQLPMFVRNDDVNMAYDNCWNADPSSCAAIMTTWIENWVGAGTGGGRQILLVPPPSRDPGASLNFPVDPSAFQTLIHQPILVPYCGGCHSSESAVAQQPYFADPDITTAYDAAKSRINLDTPANSRLVIRLRSEFHNCWSGSCTSDAQTMEDAIASFAGGLTPTTVDPNLVTSKALNLTDGTLASGGNRYEDAQIALWEFKTGSGTVAYDTSGVDPAIDLNFSGNVTWFGGWGITIADGKAQASTTASAKLFDIIQESGEFSIEAWVVPANVTQEEARIVSYSAGPTQRNFTLQQTLYDYNFQLRTTETSLNGDPALSTPAADEVLQATLQHVVATYDPINGRSIYVNGTLVTQIDPVPGGTLIDWQDTFAFVLGNEASGDGLWQGVVRLASIHRRALTPEQITQNFDAGVGERFFLLFDISESIAAAPQSSYILFEVAQYDTYAYLFDKPHFITLDGSTPEGIPIQGVRVAMNGAEAPVGQTYATLDNTLSASLFQELGQPLSALGAVLPLEKGPADDEFFLTFDVLASNSFSRQPDPTLVVSETDLDPASHIGLRTFDEINATYAEVTGVDPTTQSVDITFQELRQSLPAVADLNTFLSSHQVAIAQLAIQYCDAMIGTNANPGSNLNTMFPGFTWTNANEFGTNRDAFVNPLIDRIMGTNIGSQPDRTEVYIELAQYQDPTSAVDPNTGESLDRPDNLVDRLVAGGSDTRSIGKGVCAAMLGNAATLVQ